MKAEIFKDKKGEYRFRIIARNGKILVQSQGYKEKRNAYKTLKILINLKDIAFRFEELDK